MEMRSPILQAKRLAAVLAVWSPALVVLAMLVPLRVAIPYHDAWAFVQQYIAWQEGHFSWAEFWAPHNNHPSAVGKAIYFAVLHWAKGDVALLPLVSWSLSLLIALALGSLVRSRFKTPPRQQAAVIFLMNLSIFSAAQGHTWIWDFVFQNFIPGTCLALALWIFDRSWPLMTRCSVALFLSVVATFSFGSGFAIGFLLTPCVALATSGMPQTKRWGLILGWLAAVTFATWIALSWLAPGGIGGPSSEDLLSNVFSRPLLTAQYILMLLGLTLGLGTEVDPYFWCAAFGAGLVVAATGSLGWLWKQRRSSFFKDTLPPLILIAWALTNSSLICLARMNGSLGSAYAHRYGTFSLFFVVGTVWLVALVAIDQREKPRSDGRRWHTLLTAAVTVLLAGHFFSWIEGWRHMQVESHLMQEEKAVIAMASVVTPDKEQYWWYQREGDVVEWAQWLDRHGRLQKTRFGKSPIVSTYRRFSMELGGKAVAWSATRSASGEWRIGGTCASERGLLIVPDLMLVSVETSAKPETFIALARPRFPDDFFNREYRRRKYASHYLGWETRTALDPFTADGPVTLRAYTYDAESGRIRRIAGETTISSKKP